MFVPVFRHLSTSSVEFYEFHFTWPNAGSFFVASLGRETAELHLWSLSAFFEGFQAWEKMVCVLRHHKPSSLSGKIGSLSELMKGTMSLSRAEFSLGRFRLDFFSIFR